VHWWSFRLVWFFRNRDVPHYVCADVFLAYFVQ
jgi:hypothetical protein